MIKRIIELSVRNKLIVLLFTIALTVWGFFAMKNLSIDAVPDITNNQVQVVTVSPSLAPQEVEQFITYPIEMAMANVQGVENIRSISRYGLSVVTIVFDEKFPILKARQLVGEMLTVAAGEIPEEYGSPELMPITTGLGEIYQYTLEVESGYEDKYTITELRTIHDWIVKRQLSGIKGIVEISGFGGYLKEYEVAINPFVLNELDISIHEILEALEHNNQNTGGSYIEDGPYASYIRAEGLLKTLQDIEKIVVTTRNQVPVLISDVAEVRFGHPVRYGAMTKDGKGETVGGITLMLKGENANRAIERVKERIAEVNNSLPEGIVIKPYLDRSELVGRVLKTITTNLTEAAIIVLIVLVLLLGNLRAGLLTASVIPLSLLIAFSLMNIFGVTASIMSLGAIDFGLIVDGTVIIIEGILFHFHKNQLGKKFSREDFDQNVIKSAGNVATSAAFGVAIILIVYFPLLALTGIEGKMFKPMAVTISFALLGSILLSLTYVPAMASLIFSRNNKEKVTIADKIVAAITSFFIPIVKFSLAKKKWVLGSAIILFVLSISLFGKLGAVFIPNLEEGDLAMQMTLPPGSSLNESVKLATLAEKRLLDNFPEVRSVVSKIGTAEVPTDPMAIEDADIMISMKDRKEWTTTQNRSELIALMKEKVEEIPGAEFNFTQPIQLRFNELITGAKSDLVIKIFGEDLDVLFGKANEVAKLIKGVQGAGDIKVEQIDGLPQVIFSYNRARLAQYGLKVSDLNDAIRTAFAGEGVGVIFEGERKFDLVVRLLPEYRSNINNIKQLFVKSPSGTKVPLSELIVMEEKEGPMLIARDDTRRRITVGINVRDRDIKSLVTEVQEILDQNLSLPPGYNITYGGEFENLQAATNRLMLVLPIALALIFIMLFFTFNSIMQAAIIYGTIPLSVIGGILALWIRGLPFSISAGVGFIALFGVAVLNGIVMMNSFNLLKKQGITDVYERVIQGVKMVVRPVALTTLVATLGFIPMALSEQAGAEVQRPLATVVIGGLLVAAFFTMAVIPILYHSMETRKIRKSQRKMKAASALILLPLLFFTPKMGEAQNTISLPDALKVAEENNLKIKSGELRIEQSVALRKSNLNLGKTEIGVEYGQINSSMNDYAISIDQNFGNLFLIAAQLNYAKMEVDNQKIRQQLNIRELKQEVSVIYFSWQSQYNKVALLKQIDRIYSDFKQLAELRYSTGYSNQLEKMSIEAKFNELSVWIKQEEVLLKNIETEFNLCLNADTTYIPQTESLHDNQADLTVIEANNIAAHP
ncbi:MAG: CusA/CzcA family heavy metal efflux RND transporter, partial [Prolixibacteraceae bacterium]|nr:CusA/CzcA family heavy metal efflux RND transporter [Prolixibacteraceae bacterium]